MSEGDAQEEMDFYLRGLRDWRFTENEDKRKDPRQVIDWLGFELDSINMVVRVPIDKRNKILELAVSLSEASTATVGNIQKFAGKLAWMAQAVRGGFAYMRRIWDLMMRTDPLHKRRVIKLSAEFQEDIAFWIKFIRSWSGLRLVRSFSFFKLWVDACKTGYGGHWNNTEFNGWWFSKQRYKYHSNWKDLMTILLALRKFAHLWQHSQLDVFSDNSTAVAIVNKGSSPSKELMRIERSIATIALEYDIHLHAIWIPGASNIHADFLSRRPPPSSRY